MEFMYWFVSHVSTTNLNKQSNQTSNHFHYQINNFSKPKQYYEVCDKISLVFFLNIYIYYIFHLIIYLPFNNFYLNQGYSLVPILPYYKKIPRSCFRPVTVCLTIWTFEPVRLVPIMHHFLFNIIIFIYFNYYQHWNILNLSYLHFRYLSL